jgi:hypothetical protein
VILFYLLRFHRWALHCIVGVDIPFLLQKIPRLFMEYIYIGHLMVEVSHVFGVFKLK